jgi:hypothetical protein
MKQLGDPMCGMGEPMSEMDEPICGMDEPMSEMDEPICGMDDPMSEMDEPICEVRTSLRYFVSTMGAISMAVPSTRRPWIFIVCGVTSMTVSARPA